jgi:hypothetical protein
MTTQSKDGRRLSLTTAKIRYDMEPATMTNEVAELLEALHAGTLTTEDVAQRFRDRRWPRQRREAASGYDEILAGETSDPDTYTPGSFDDVIAAYDQQRINREQLRIFSEAVAESQRAEDADLA